MLNTQSCRLSKTGILTSVLAICFLLHAGPMEALSAAPQFVAAENKDAKKEKNKAEKKSERARNKRLAELKERLERTDRALATEKKNATKYKSTIGDLERKLRVSQRERDASSKISNDRHLQVKQLEERIEKLTRQSSDIKKLEATLNRQKEAASELATQKDTLSQTNATAQQRIVELEKRLGENIGTKAGYTSELKLSRERATKLSDDIDTLTREREGLRKSLKEQESATVKLTDEIRTSETAQDNSRDRIRSLEAQLTKSKAAANNQIRKLETTLGERLEMVTDIQSETRSLRENLESQKDATNKTNAEVTELRATIDRQASELETKTNQLSAFKIDFEQFRQKSANTGDAMKKLQAKNELLAKSRDEVVEKSKSAADSTKQLTANLRKLETELTQTLASKDADQERLATLQKELQQSKQATRKLESDLAATNKQLADRANELKTKTSRLSAFNVDLSQLRSKLTDNESQFAALRSDRKDLQEAKEAATQNLQKAREQTEALNEERNELVAAQEEANKTTAQLREDLAKQQRLNEAIAADVEDTEKALAARTEALRKARTELKSTHHSFSLVQGELATNVAAFASLKTDREGDLKALAAKTELSEELAVKQDELIAAQKKADEQAIQLREDLAKRQKRNEELQANIAAMKSTIENRTMELSVAEENLAATNERAVALKSQLKSKSTAFASLETVRDSLRVSRDEVMNKLNAKSVAESKLADQLKATNNTLQSSKESIESLKKEQQKLTAAKDAADEKVASLRKQAAERANLAKELERQLTAAKFEATKQAGILKTKSNTLLNTVALVEQLRGSIKQNESDFSSLQSEQEALTKRYVEANNRVAELRQSLKERETESQSLEKRLADRSAKSEQLAQQLKQRETQKDELADQLSAAKKELESTTSELGDKSATASRLATNLEQLKRNLAKTEAQVTNLETNKTKLDGARTAASDRATRLQTELEAAKQKVAELGQKVEQLTELTKLPSTISIQQAADGSWDLIGEVADAKTKSAIDDIARSVFEGAIVNNSLSVSDRIKSSGWLKGLPSVLTLLQSSNVNGLGIQIEADAIEVNGAVGNQAERARITRGLQEIDWSGGDGR